MTAIRAYITKLFEDVHIGDEILEPKHLVVDEITVTAAGWRISGLPPHRDAGRRIAFEGNDGDEVKAHIGPAELDDLFVTLHAAIARADDADRLDDNDSNWPQTRRRDSRLILGDVTLEYADDEPVAASEAEPAPLADGA